jgi:metal-sulfur cluster biosynthetic enzyme
MELTAERVRRALEAVIDPELMLNVVELGLIRDVVVSKTHVQVHMTLTFPGCPYGPEIYDRVLTEIKGVAGGREPVLEMVWVPPWDPRTDASDEVKAELDIWD